MGSDPNFSSVSYAHNSLNLNLGHQHPRLWRKLQLGLLLYFLESCGRLEQSSYSNVERFNVQQARNHGWRVGIQHNAIQIPKKI